jgi:DnaK suppressor protein
MEGVEQMRKSTQATSAKPDYRAALLAMKSEVMSNLGIKVDAIASCARVNEEDQAQLSHDEFLQLRLNSLDYEKLRLVDAALARLYDGEYGVCAGCEEPIPGRRLEVIPWAEYCVSCQETAGQRETQEEAPAARYAHFANQDECPTANNGAESRRWRI